MHSPSSPAGPAAIVIGLLFRSMSTTVMHHSTSRGTSRGTAIVVVSAKTMVVDVVLTVTVLEPIATWNCAVAC